MDDMAVLRLQMEELELRRQADEALKHALGDPAKAAIARIAYQMIINGWTEAEVRASIGQKAHKPKVNLAEKRRAELEANFRARGHAISVPKPNVSNTTLKRWRREGRELFYRPATAEVSYTAWMTSHGRSKHWTVASETDRAKIGWEDATAGYWFTAEIAPACPNLNVSWDDLTARPSLRLLSLEEYAIVYWTHRVLTGERIDVSTWCWLRTRCGLSALLAYDYDGGVHVYGHVTADLAIPNGGGGGRAVGVVQIAA